MNDEKIVQIFNGIDDELICEANEDMNFWLKSQEGIVVRVDDSQRFSWRTVITSVACTAAVMVGVFIVLLNIGKIGIIDSSTSFDSQSGIILDLPANTVIFEEAAYAYEYDSDELKRFEVGEKFGEKADIISAKTTYKIADGVPVIQKQEITLATDFVAEYVGTTFVKDGDMITPADIHYGLAEFGLPSFGEGFEIDPITLPPDMKENIPILIRITRLEITADYEAKVVHLHTDDDFITITSKEDIANEN